MPGLAWAQESRKPTTSRGALEGMAVEPKPDYTLVAKFATYDLDLLYGVDEIQVATGSSSASSSS